MTIWLMDTGPLVAYLDASDPDHELVSKALNGFSGQLVTTSAVVTEAMHFVAEDNRGPDILVSFLETSRTNISECCQPDALRRAVKLMRKYSDTPMDFADASLILLGEQIKQTLICTLDRRGFTTYRTTAGKRFQLVLDGG